MIIKSKISSTFIGQLDHMTTFSRMSNTSDEIRKERREKIGKRQQEKEFTTSLQRTLVEQLQIELVAFLH